MKDQEMPSSAEHEPPSRRLQSIPQTHGVRFILGEALPHDDPVAHFIVSLGSAMNDLILINTLLVPPFDPEHSDFTAAERLSLFRLVVSELWEVGELVRTADKIERVRTFIDQLASDYDNAMSARGSVIDGETLVGRLRGSEGLLRKALRDRVRKGRLGTYHYLAPNDKKLVVALRDAREKETRYAFGERMGSIRAEFADDVMLEMFSFDGTEQIEELLAEAADLTVAVIHLAQVAIDRYLAEAGCVVTPIAD